MDVGALELHLRRLPGVVACQLTATDVVLLLSGGDPEAVRIAAQAALDQAGSDRTVRVLAPALPTSAPAPWRRRRFAVLAGAAGALSAGIAAATTLASMPGAVSSPRESAIAVPDVPEPAADPSGVRTLVPAPARAIAGQLAQGPDALADPGGPAPAGEAAGADARDAGVVAGLVLTRPAGVTASESAVRTPSAPASPAPAPPVQAEAIPAPQPEPDVVAASDGDDHRRSRRGRPDHPHGGPPGHLQRVGHGPW